jgi:prepilin-type N-terminal cleavage/methylation domain-containing protein
LVQLVMGGTFSNQKAPPAGAFCVERSRGFTVIELVAVIAIAGVLIALATPRFLDMQPYEQRGYADEIAAGLRYSRTVATASGCNVLFSVNLAGYNAAQHAAGGGIFAGHCAPGGAWPTAVNRADGTPLAGAPPPDVNIAAAAQVEFDANGNVVGGAAVIVAIGPHTVTVSPGGGVAVQ